MFLFSEETVPQYEEHSFLEHFHFSWDVAHSTVDQYKTRDQHNVSGSMENLLP
jgi:hypothetical protein